MGGSEAEGVNQEVENVGGKDTIMYTITMQECCGKEGKYTSTSAALGVPSLSCHETHPTYGFNGSEVRVVRHSAAVINVRCHEANRVERNAFFVLRYEHFKLLPGDLQVTVPTHSKHEATGKSFQPTVADTCAEDCSRH